MGAGKSFAASVFENLGVPVFDADAAVHQFWFEAAVQADLQQLLGCTKKIERADAKLWLDFDPQKLRQLEAVLYPHLNQALQSFLGQHKNAACVVLDVPLLFEKNWHRLCHTTICMVAPALLCQRRALKRPHASKAFYNFIKTQHWPQAQKAKLANCVISSLWGKAYVRWRLKRLLQKLTT